MNKIKTTFLIFCLVFLTAFVVTAQAASGEADDDLRVQIRAKEAEIERLEAEEAKYREALSKSQENERTLKNQIASIDARIKRLQADLNVTKAKINKAELNIKLFSGEIKEHEKTIKTRGEAMARSLRLLVYLDSESLVAAILKNSRFSEFLSRSRYLANLESALYDDFKALTRAKADLEELVGREKETKNDLSDLKNDLTAKNRLVTSQKSEKNELLKETKNQEREYQEIISDIQARQAKIQQEIFELEGQLRGEVAGVPPPRPGALAWPLVGRLTQTYGPTSVTGFYNDVYKFHNGIDIAAYYGAPIRAALDGTVIGSGTNGKYAYGNWLAIRHNNGLTTLYAHLASKTVNFGQTVSQGQVIGYEGATGFVTGPHLHFTVYSTNTFRIEARWFGALPLGGSVNPLDYL